MPVHRPIQDDQVVPSAMMDCTPDDDWWAAIILSWLNAGIDHLLVLPLAHSSSLGETGLITENERRRSEAQCHWSHSRWRYLDTPDSKVHGANKGPIWSRQDLSGPHGDPMNLAIWDRSQSWTSGRTSGPISSSQKSHKSCAKTPNHLHPKKRSRDETVHPGHK